MELSWLLARLRRVPARELPARLAREVRRRLDERSLPSCAAPRGAWDEGWPRARASSIDLLGSGLDPRTAWEHARLVHLAGGADRRSVEAALRFCDEHPPGVGLAWTTSAEVAHRLASLATLAERCPDVGLVSHVRAHAAFVARYPTLPSSAANHRVAELSALALAVAGVPGAPRAWSRQVATLPEVLRAQLGDDGLGVERAPAYLAQCVEWGLLARRSGVSGLDGTLARAADALVALLDDGGHAPELGDDDGGCVLPGPRDRYALSVVGATACALGLPAPAAWSPDERSRALATGAPSGIRHERSRLFPEAGITVLRAGRIRVVFDHGALGGPPLAAHGHADALGVWISIDGQPVIGARGTGRYVGDPGLRRFHRGTASHPTLVVDGADQSVQHDHPFLWRTRATARLERADLAALVATASHDGYLRRRGVVHRRTVEVADDRVVLRDTLVGRGRHHVAIVLPLSPGAELDVRPDPRCVVREREDLHRPTYGSPGVPARTLLLEAVVDAGTPLVTELRAAR